MKTLFKNQTLRDSLHKVGGQMMIVAGLLGTSISASGSILPDNDLHLQDGMFLFSNMDEELFNEIVDKVGDYYAPIVASHGGELKMEKLWSNSLVNASASRDGNTWFVNMYGGLARRPEVTADAFLLVVCHEMGHHLGGVPLKTGRWAASEGQSDYFAAQVCAKEFWKDEVEVNALYRNDVDPVVALKCDASYSDLAGQDLCYRVAYAGLSLGNLFASLRLRGAEVSFDAADPTEVTTTSTSHPNAQCRLDTYTAGAACSKEFNQWIIPGVDENGELKSLDEGLSEALENSCSKRDVELSHAARPKCWFKHPGDFLLAAEPF